MAEQVTSAPPSTPSPSPSSSTAGSSSDTSTPPSSAPAKEQPTAAQTAASKRAEIVRALLERRLAKDGTITPKETKTNEGKQPEKPADEPKTAKPTEGTPPPKAQPQTHDGKPAEGKVAKQQDKNGLDKLAQDANKPPEPAKEEKPEPREDPDLVLARRLAAISRREAEGKARDQQVESRVRQLENFHGQLTKYNQFLTELPRDPETALKHLGFDDKMLDSLYWKLNERAVASQRPPTQEEFEARQRQITQEEWQRLQWQQQQQAQQTVHTSLAQARDIYMHRIAQAFNANLANYPYVKAFGVDAGDIHSWVEEQFGKQGKVPMPDEVLQHFEQRLSQRGIEASGNRRIEAPMTEQPEPVVNQTVTSNWSAGAVPVDKSPSQSLKESREEIKRRLEQGFFSRRP